MKAYVVVADGKEVVKAYTKPGLAKAYVTKWKNGTLYGHDTWSHLAVFEISTVGLTPLVEAGTLPTEQPPMVGQEPLFDLLDSDRPIV